MEYVKTKYSHVIKCKPEDIDCIVYEKGMSNKSIKEPFAVNGTFFSYESTGKYFSTSPLVVNGKAHRWGSNHGKPQSCFIIWKDNSITIQRVNNISEIDLNKVKHIFGGVGLINKLDTSFKYDPASEGFSGKFSDVLRRTNKTVLAYRKSDNAMMVFAIENKTHDEVIKILESHGIDVACCLDGGGSAFMNANGVKVKGDGRKVANAIVVKGIDETKPQNASQLKHNLVIISDGHGENTSGKRSHQFDDGYVLKENHFNEPVVDYIKSNLSKYKCEICHVSDGKGDTSLNDRTDMANKVYKEMCDKYGKANVDCIYVSVHANHDGGKNWSQANGIDTFAYPKSDKTLHTLLLNKLIAATGLRNRGVKEENFHELRETSMTACLCECGFMSNLNEATLLRSDEYRRKCANAITDGIVEYMKLEKVAEDKPVEPPKEDNKLYRVCVGSYSDKANADKMMAELASKGYKPFIAVYEK